MKYLPATDGATLDKMTLRARSSQVCTTGTRQASAQNSAVFHTTHLIWQRVQVTGRPMATRSSCCRPTSTCRIARRRNGAFRGAGPHEALTTRTFKCSYSGARARKLSSQPLSKRETRVCTVVRLAIIALFVAKCTTCIISDEEGNIYWRVAMSL